MIRANGPTDYRQDKTKGRLAMTFPRTGTRRDAYRGVAKLGFLVALLILLPLTVAAPVLTRLEAAQQIIVNTTVDESTSADGLCSLREALNNANAKADTTSGDCVAGTGTDTITFNVSGTISLAS